jgi:hypothetical protein
MNKILQEIKQIDDVNTLRKIVNVIQKKIDTLCNFQIGDRVQLLPMSRKDPCFIGLGAKIGTITKENGQKSFYVEFKNGEEWVVDGISLQKVEQ